MNSHQYISHFVTLPKLGNQVITMKV